MIEIGRAKVSHLQKSLRIKSPIDVSYTDGQGVIGHGTYENGRITRGRESVVARPSNLVLAVAPPRNRDRQRFLVEKVSEMGIERIRWLQTDFGERNPPPEAKSRSWASSALEQSRGGWVTEIDVGLTLFDELEPPIVACDKDGTDRSGEVRTVVVGPEGGWSESEIPADIGRWTLGSTVLRTETAAVVAAARVLGSYGNG